MKVIILITQFGSSDHPITRSPDHPIMLITGCEDDQGTHAILLLPITGSRPERKRTGRPITRCSDHRITGCEDDHGAHAIVVLPITRCEGNQDDHSPQITRAYGAPPSIKIRRSTGLVALASLLFEFSKKGGSAGKWR
jgi:hypothetical protein